VTTRNQGTGLSYATTTRFYVSTDTVVDPSDPRIEQAQAVPMLAPNTSSAATIGLTIPSMPTGTYYLIAKADADGLLLESQEGNNTRARVIYIGPDLVVTSLTGPSGVVPGMPMTLNYTVGNSGGVTAPLSSLRFFWSSNSSLDASDTLLGSQNVGPVAGAGSASGQVTVTTPANATIGNFYVIAEADSTKVIPETQETNNTASLVVRIGGDLTVSAVTAPSSLGAGLSYSFGDTTKNEGGVQVGATVTQFYLSTDSVLSAGDPLIGSRPVAALGPGVSNAGTANVTIPPGTLAGSYYLFAKADGTNAVSESLETNNTASRTVTIGPDLTADIDLVTSPVAAGAQAQVKESTTNRGGAATGAFNIGYYLSVDFYLDAADVRLAPNRTISSLAVGATNFGTTLVTIPQGTAPGWYYLIVKADADGAVGESSETNNTWPRSVRVE
jgi:subtilase family serine protease